MDLASLIDNGLTVGLIVCALIFIIVARLRTKKSDDKPRLNAWQKLVPGLVVALVLGVMAIAIVSARSLWSSPEEESRRVQLAPSAWRDVTSSDGVLTVTMPGVPKLEKRDDKGDEGPTRFVKQSVAIEDGRVIFDLMAENARPSNQTHPSFGPSEPNQRSVITFFRV